MRITPNRLEKVILAVPIWHPFVLAILIGAPTGIIAATTSHPVWAIWLVAFTLAMSLLALDVLIHRHAGWRHRPGTWSRYRIQR